jgi:hypothetical protein
MIDLEPISPETASIGWMSTVFGPGLSDGTPRTGSYPQPSVEVYL